MLSNIRKSQLRFVNTGINRITEHPVLEIPKDRKVVSFEWNGKKLEGYEGEALSTALIAHNEHIFGYHTKDNAPQGIYCANGQCSQCNVVVEGLVKKACMEPLKEGLSAEFYKPTIPLNVGEVIPKDIEEIDVDVLIIGGGPSGLSAARELGSLGVKTLLIDDKDRLGGKLVLQTHKFFGSSEDCYSGTRGFVIGDILSKEITNLASVDVKLNTTALAVFSDKKVGIVQDGKYTLVNAKKVLNAAGAREKFLSFPGNTLPGVYGAGAFQTLVNRDLVRPSKKMLIVGGGNVGLIGGYHAIQADVEVVALIEAMDKCGGYKVHEDKLMRLGVPILTRHTIVAVDGDDHVKSATIGRLDENWNVIPGTEKTYEVDTVLLAVGLEECNEFTKKGNAYGLDMFTAGDAAEIAEASAAMFTGKIAGRKILKSLGYDVEVPVEWDEKARIMKAHPGPADMERENWIGEGVIMPVFHCFQDIPCDACTASCSLGNIITGEEGILEKPTFAGDEGDCNGCTKCVATCPGLAITLVDTRKSEDEPTVTFPYEVWREDVEVGKKVAVMDDEGAFLGKYDVTKLRKDGETLLVSVKVPRKHALKAASVVTREDAYKSNPIVYYERQRYADETIVCRCERVNAKEIREVIQEGARDMNQIKAATRAGMGACGGKTCTAIINRIFREEGVPYENIQPRVERPLYIEVTLGTFAGLEL